MRYGAGGAEIAFGVCGGIGVGALGLGLWTCWALLSVLLGGGVAMWLFAALPLLAVPLAGMGGLGLARTGIARIGGRPGLGWTLLRLGGAGSLGSAALLVCVSALPFVVCWLFLLYLRLTNAGGSHMRFGTC